MRKGDGRGGHPFRKLICKGKEREINGGWGECRQGSIFSANREGCGEKESL